MDIHRYLLIDIYTIQLAQWRKLKETNIVLIDATLKSGDTRLAPDPKLLFDYKSGSITDNEYSDRYLKIMRNRFRENKHLLLDLLAGRDIAIACYCKANTFCHRLILKDILMKIAISENIELVDKGEFV